MFAGALLLLLGVLMLLEQMGIIYGSFWDYFWPACIVAVGLHLIFKAKQRTG